MSFSNDRWSPEEREAFAEAYRLGGIVECRKVLPHRSDDAMRNKVLEMGLSNDNAQAIAARDAKRGSALLLDALLRMNARRMAA